MVRWPGRSCLAVMAMLAGVAVWLWPLGIGGRMPVGGDVTSFSMGLMAFLHDALRAGRLPVWNDLWGYGFPALAESQMGVYYPPHVLLYGLLRVEVAYTASLVLHTAWAALGGFWAARRFGCGPAGAGLAGFAFAASGFFLVHLPHQWGYTVGCWMPWAWGLAWELVHGRPTWRAAALLSIVLTVQVLPGHFQLAFITQIGVLFIAVCGGGAGWRGALAVVGALAAAPLLGAAQLWPTLRLAHLAASQRDYQYLAEFACTPFHLVSYVAPRLFHASALWRPLVWDPFRTSPEEHLAYVGLVPLALAVVGLRKLWRQDRGVRVLTGLAALTIILSLGPHVPGFPLLCRLPGFSFFRAPARWSFGTALALCILAGRGFDLVADLPRPGRGLRRFVAVSTVAILLALGTVELALWATAGRGQPQVAGMLDRALGLLPWPVPPRVRTVGQAARAYHPDLILSYARDEARDGRTIDLFTAAPRFVNERTRIYVRELIETGALLAAVSVLSACDGRRGLFAGGLLVLTGVDLIGLGHHRAVDIAPIAPLTQQSTVLARLAREPHGTRVVTPVHNLPMVAGVAPLRAYRTLDLAALPALTNRASSPLQVPGVPAAMRVAGAGLRVTDAFEHRLVARTGETIADPALASWIFGADLVGTQGDWLTRFAVVTPVRDTARAWHLDLTGGRGAAMLANPGGDVASLVRLFEHAEPLEVRSDRPGRVEMDVESAGRAVVVVSQLADPQWRARWVGARGERPAAIEPAFRASGQAGWQAIAVPEPGTWTLRLEYDARDVRQGLWISAGAWLALGAGLIAIRLARRTRRNGGTAE